MSRPGTRGKRENTASSRKRPARGGLERTRTIPVLLDEPGPSGVSDSVDELRPLVPSNQQESTRGFVSMCQQSADIVLRPLSSMEADGLGASSGTAGRRAFIPELLLQRLMQMALVVPALRDRPRTLRTRLLNQSSSLGYAILAIWKLDAAQQNLVARMASGDMLFIYSASNFRSLCDAMHLSYDSIVDSNRRFSQGLTSNFPDRQVADVVRVALALTYIFSPHHITTQAARLPFATRPSIASQQLRTLLDVHSSYMRCLTQFVHSVSGDRASQGMMRMIFCYEALADLQLLEGFGSIQNRQPRAVRYLHDRLPLAYVQPSPTPSQAHHSTDSNDSSDSADSDSLSDSDGERTLRPRTSAHSAANTSRPKCDRPCATNKAPQKAKKRKRM